MRTFYGLACLLLLLGVAFSLRWIMAEYYAHEVSLRISEWSLAEKISSTDEWDNTMSMLEKAISLNPKQAEYFSSKAVLYELKATSADDEIRNQAIAAYRQSIALRPAWPDTWAQLALQKAMLGQEDPELKMALIRALELGLNEDRIQTWALQVILISWPLFSGDDEINQLMSK